MTAQPAVDVFTSLAVQPLVVCCEVRKGEPRRASDVFGSNAPDIMARRVFEVAF